MLGFGFMKCRKKSAPPPPPAPRHHVSPRPATCPHSSTLAQVCGEAEVLRATFPTFSLPTDGQRLSLLLALSSLDCSSRQRGVLLSMGGSGSSSSSNSGSSSTPAVDVDVDCAKAQLLLASSGLGTATYKLPDLSNGSLALLLSQDRQVGSFVVCLDGTDLPALAGSSPALLQHLAGAGSLSGDLLGPAVVVGTRSSALSARADLAALYVTDSRIACQQTQPGEQQAALLQELSVAAAAARERAAQPSVAVQQQHPAGDGVVGEPLHLSVTATPASGALADAHRWVNPPGPAAVSSGGLLLDPCGGCRGNFSTPLSCLPCPDAGCESRCLGCPLLDVPLAPQSAATLWWKRRRRLHRRGSLPL